MAFHALFFRVRERSDCAFCGSAKIIAEKMANLLKLCILHRKNKGKHDETRPIHDREGISVTGTFIHNIFPHICSNKSRKWVA